ncbi:MAG TPA: radical SAM protein [Alphaproteobacteria bacterium]|jgi:radical SAM superfamily enzyme YgiQ (UPF0313 family)|nr:radical SAM protein [Alphaproteobacteria bacterium]
MTAGQSEAIGRAERPRSTSRTARNARHILCVFPRYAPSFGTFQHAFPLIPGVRAFMPPQGLLVIAAYLPKTWHVRFVDENVAPATDADLDWADAVLTSGMHVQRRFIDDLNARAHRRGRLTVLGGPSVSACPDYYPDVDILHVGELGDATDALIDRLDASVARPSRQIVLTTVERVPLDAFPAPAYDRLDIRRYFMGSIQFSSGCPFRCEFCDIPALYGRNPRLKTPAQITGELDAMVRAGGFDAVYFVDDNFIANPRAARELLPHLIRWQKANGYRLRFACEATLNMAQMPELLALMREAAFYAVFVGIETPEPHALEGIRKQQNLRLPILDAVATFNSYGMEVVSGIIMGLDTDGPETGRAIRSFIDISNIPLLTINLLYALPRTPLHERLAGEGRLLSDDEAAGRVSNVRFRLPYDDVVRQWYDTVTDAYRPDKLLARFRHQTRTTYARRLAVPRKPSWAQIRRGLGVLARIFWHCGMRRGWRRAFWRMALPLLRRGRIEEMVSIATVAHHLVTFVGEIRAGKHEACFYADPSRSTMDARRSLRRGCDTAPTLQPAE